MTTPTDLSQLPSYKRRPVPWIARWSGEVKNDPYTLFLVQGEDEEWPHLRLTYPDGEDETRDDRDILWQREGIGRNGVPLYSQVSTLRQKLAMRKRLCQVCGQKIEGPITPWIMDVLESSGAVERVGGDPVTSTAPVCEGCIEVARKHCPHLSKHGSQIWDVLEYEIWGVFGEVVYLVDGKPQRAQMTLGFDQDYGKNFHFDQVLAKQQVVKITKYRVRS